jgi:hypothetical protein
LRIAGISLGLFCNQVSRPTMEFAPRHALRFMTFLLAGALVRRIESWSLHHRSPSWMVA